MTELLRCPLCGSKAHMCEMESGYGTEYAICCNYKGCRLSEHPMFGHACKTEAEAIAAWNTRTPVEYEGWFYLPKPKNSLVHYGTPQIEKTENCYKAKQSVEVIESAIRAWGDELGEHIMKRICEVWNTSTHGTLTAEQVRDAVLVNFEETHETRYDHWEPSKFDWQAIADELNAERHVETCENMREKFGYKRLFVCSECGVTFDPDCKINYCPWCGREVVG